MKFCYKCGKNIYKENLCKEHYIDTLLPVFNKIEISMCKKCEKIFYHNKWSKTDLKKIIEKYIKIKKEIKLHKINIKNSDIEIVFFISELNEYKKLIYKIKIIKKICLDCLKITGNYYEAIFQLRGNIPDWAISYIKNAEGFIKIEKRKEGLDFFILKRNNAENISKFFKGKKYQIKKSFKLITKKDGRDVYRFFYCIKF